ncbi:MAG: hypothetical protein A3E78_11845 [Alphaproteobacteria bacterium RIFCSPHIGHO2_12_FULL_63_12]|nr:MAG: hypothetical protein A3E78_11845 [Alphaproteobacteria bacterium RIFCSPHIGHO2_12_FULL_63_12]
MTRIPSAYQRAEWRNTTPVDPETGLIGIGFGCEFDEPPGVIRLALDLDNARAVRDTLRELLEEHDRKSLSTIAVSRTDGSIVDVSLADLSAPSHEDPARGST